MRSTSLRGPAWVLLLGLALGVALPQGARGAPTAAGEPVSFDTADGVELHGTFYPSDQGKRAPCVLLLTEVGGNHHQDGWDDLARKLQGKGYAVLGFDFRGHGESTTVDEEFWLYPINRTLRGSRSARARNEVHAREFTSLYHYGMLVNDIAAAKRFLDHKNDAEECNSANLAVLGADSGATLGALWIATEWQRRRLTRAAPFDRPPWEEPEGEDIACAVWLSISSKIHTWRVPVESWLRSPVRERVPMYFLYGEEDRGDANFARRLSSDILRADRLKLTGKRAIPGTKASGRELLTDAPLGTADLIVRYLQQVYDGRGHNVWAKSGVDTAPFVLVPFERYLR